MFLQPSTSFQFNDKRLLFAAELATGGHGQVYLSGAGTFTPTNSSFVFYQIQFLTNSVVSNAGFRTVASDGTTKIYEINGSTYTNVGFSSGDTWFAPITSITLASGRGIAYQYSLFNPQNQFCNSSCS
jgi:hypothetical protein